MPWRRAEPSARLGPRVAARYRPRTSISASATRAAGTRTATRSTSSPRRRPIGRRGRRRRLCRWRVPRHPRRPGLGAPVRTRCRCRALRRLGVPYGSRSRAQYRRLTRTTPPGPSRGRDPRLSLCAVPARPPHGHRRTRPSRLPRPRSQRRPTKASTSAGSSRASGSSPPQQRSAAPRQPGSWRTVAAHGWAASCVRRRGSAE
jgi:hypothetical protein